MADRDVATETGFTTRMVSAGDGLRLAVRDYGPPASETLPLVCLPGLTRTAADFHELAAHFANDPRGARRVLALDYRGRGASERARHWREYDVRVEAADVLQVMDAVGVHEAVLIGTSRGGLIAMALGAIRPAAIAAVVLNDVGPVIDARGLMRIRGHMSKLPKPKDLAEGALILRRMMDVQFPKLTDAEWDTMARQMWRPGKKGLVVTYDPKIAKTLTSIDLEVPLPPLWSLFEGLKRVPVLCLRGANSDVLAQATVAEMAKRHPLFESIVVPDQGHAPLLSGADLLGRIGIFVETVERGREKRTAAA